jgi:thiamine monophosphate kinase
MTSAELEKLARLGQLEREPPVVSEIRGLLRSGEARLSKGHETRNMAEYEGALDVDEGLVADLIKAAEAVRVALRAAGLPQEV